MEQILHQILSTASTVILPHFGAIIKLGDSYQFNEFLKYNDGKLIKAVEESKGVSSEEATEIVSDYIRSIKEHLNADKDFNIGSIGVFSKKGEKVIIKKGENSSTTPKSKPVVKKEVSKPTPPKKEETPIKKEDPKTVPVTPKETTTTEQAKTTPKKEVSTNEALPKAYTSTNLVLDKAIDKLNSLKSEKEIEAFVKGEKREQVLTIAKQKIDGFKTPKVKPAPSIKKEEKTPIVTPEVKKSDSPESKKPTKEEPKEKIAPIVTSTPKEDKKPTDKKAEIKVTPTPVVKEEAKPATKVEAKKEEVKKEEKKEETKIKAVPTPVNSAKKEEKKPSDEEIKDALKSGAIVIEKEAKKRKRRRFILWAAILLLLIGTSIIGFIKKNEILALINKTQVAEHKDASSSDHNTKQKDKEDHSSKENESHHDSNNHSEEHTNADNHTEENSIHEEEAIAEENYEEHIDSENQESEHEESSEEEVIEEEEEVEEEIEDPEVIEEAKPVAKGKYNIVVGSFSEENNANKLVKKLNEEGYSNAKVLGKYGGLHAVSIDNFESRTDAKSALSDVKGKGYSGWIKKIK